MKGWASIPESYVTHVPVLSIDRVLGRTLHGKRALILVDIEGAEFLMLQGAVKTLGNVPRAIWVVEICSTEHQPAGMPINANFAQTFKIFFSQGYRAYTIGEKEYEVTWEVVTDIVNGKHKLETHNFLFR